MTTTAQVREYLKRRYAAPEWALLEEVRNGTGWVKDERYADAVAMSLYPSRGLSVLGFEIKVSRADWLRELKNPDKSTSIQKYCDAWWVVAGDPNIVRKDEVPMAWGLMVCGGNRLNIVKDAPKLSAADLDRSFVASMMRRMSQATASVVSSDEVAREHFERGKAAALLDAPKEQQQLRWDYEALQTRVKQFEEVSGFTLDRWQYGALVEAMKRVKKDLLGPEPDRALANARETLSASLKYVEAMQLIADLHKKGDLALPP